MFRSDNILRAYIVTAVWRQRTYEKDDRFSNIIRREPAGFNRLYLDIRCPPPLFLRGRLNGGVIIYGSLLYMYLHTGKYFHAGTFKPVNGYAHTMSPGRKTLHVISLY